MMRALGKRRCNGFGAHPYRWAPFIALVLGTSPVAITAQGSEGVHPFFGQSLPIKREVEIHATVGGDPELTEPRTVLADASSIYVLDPAAVGVHRFDRDGAWQNTFGRKGEGPGEFRRPDAMGWVSDTLWVADPGLNRLSFFDRNGGFFRSIRFNVHSGRTRAIPRRAWGAQILSVPYFPLRSTPGVDSIPILVFDENGAVQDTLVWGVSGQVAVSVTIGGRNGSEDRTVSIRHRFDHRSMMAYDPMSRWAYRAKWKVGSNEREFLELLRIGATGDTTASSRMPLSRAELSESDIRTYASELYGTLPEVVRARMSIGELTRAFLEQVATPSRPSVDAMVASEDGTIWFRQTAQMGVETPQHWVAYQPGWESGAHVVLPVGYSLLSASGGLLWTKSENALGLPTITGWKVSWPDAPR